MSVFYIFETLDDQEEGKHIDIYVGGNDDISLLILWLSTEAEKPSFRSRLWCNMQYALCSRRLQREAGRFFLSNTAFISAHNSYSSLEPLLLNM